jgi:nitroimidazol reductase NimA-like FMN-containing flavoprotein (pyridoxamine 5'-phosphate oxidase superfamily)
LYRRSRETTPSRHPERARYDHDTVHAILDEALLGHLAFVVDGRPEVLPTLFVREGTTLYLHSSTGARPARMAARRKGIAVSFEATLVDGLVLARSTFNHSINYRSVVVLGTVTVVEDTATKRHIMNRLVEKIIPGRSADARGATDDELRQTAVLALPLESVSAKVRSGDPKDDEADMESRCWAGVVPVLSGRGAAEASSDLAPGIEIPSYLTRPPGPEVGPPGASA